MALTEHPDRHVLSDEVHARPPVLLEAPVTVWSVTLQTEPGANEIERAWLAEFARSHELNPPEATAAHALLDAGSYLCKWERHTEFTNYVFYKRGLHVDATLETLGEHLPGINLERFPGRVVSAIRILVTEGEHLEDSELPSEPVAAESRVLSSRAHVRAGFRIERHGFSSMHVATHGLSARQGGRCIQSLLDIESYRLMALLSLPLARQVHNFVTRAETELAALTADCLAPGGERDAELLARLVDLAARVEESVAHSQNRFSAADAYYAIILHRVADLHEAHVSELPTLGEFLERRLAPAMRTCASGDQRQEALSGRVSRTVALLRTRVDVARQEETHEILAALNRRALLQLRLQQAVEGLSIAAITYYGSALVGYLAKGVARTGLHLDSELAMVASIPLIALATWAALRRVRRSASTEAHR